MKRGLVLAALSALSLPAFGNLLVNGDFELSVPNNGTGNGWTAFNNDGAGGWRSSGGNPNGMYILNDNGTSQSNPTIEQTVNGLTVGWIYRISGDYTRGNISHGGNLDLGVEVDGNLWEYHIPPTNWEHFSEVFTASSSTVTVRLTGERHGDSDPRIDNITLELEAVPEPASLVAVAAGLALLRRRRTR